jgi:hypothetical protein
MRPLPKGEYKLLKALQLAYDVSDDSEMVAVALMALHAIHLATPSLVLEYIQTFRNNPHAERVYPGIISPEK